MSSEDQQILNWIMERDMAVPDDVAEIVAAIREHNKSTLKS